jgi:hypothetical protein
MPDLKTTRLLRSLLISGGVALALGGGGCYPNYTAGGPQASYDLFTYEGKPENMRQITLVDTGTGEPIWTVEVPIGKELVVRFFDDFDTKNPERPSLMRWEIMNLDETYGELNNAMPVPPSYRRRLDTAFVHKPVVAISQPLTVPAAPPAAPAAPAPAGTPEAHPEAPPAPATPAAPAAPPIPPPSPAPTTPPQATPQA